MKASDTKQDAKCQPRMGAPDTNLDDSGKAPVNTVLYECGICDCYHPWSFDGDCREDKHRYGSPEDYAEKHNLNPDDLDIRSMEDRIQADEGGSAL